MSQEIGYQTRGHSCKMRQSCKGLPIKGKPHSILESGGRPQKGS